MLSTVESNDAALEESAEPFPTANGPIHSVRLFAGREQQQIAVPLVISFVVKMRDVVTQRESK